MRTAPLVLALLAGSLFAAHARAQCCSGYTEATACADAGLTRSRWCIQDTVPTGQNALPKAFCSYGDQVVTTLESLFNIKAGETFEFELDTQTGGAHTGTACRNLGVGVAYDAFVGKAYNATGFWGYLLSLHEAINDWTGMSSPGWPTDWWADHQSAFPNLMDFHIMATIGTTNGDQNLLTAAAAQKKRFYPGGDSADSKVVALDNVFAAMPGGDGYAGFSRLMALQSADGVKWDNLGVPNPDVKRSEYVVAYMSLAAGQSVLNLLQGPGANNGGGICNGTPDGTAGDAPYVCSQANIDAIATAHCALAANGKPASGVTALRGGNYGNIASGPCGASCPAECGCDGAGHCVAAWLGQEREGGTPAADAGSGGGGGRDGGSAGIGGRDGGQRDSGSGGAAAGAGGGSAGAAGTAGAGGSSGTPGAAGSAGSGVGRTGGAGGVASPGGNDAAVAGNSGTSAAGADSSGCSCSLERKGVPAPLSVVALALVALGLERRRRRG